MVGKVSRAVAPVEIELYNVLVDTLNFGDPNQALLYAIAITGFGGLVGAIGYAIAANRGARRLGLAVATGLVIGAGAIAWSIFFTPFYAVEVDANAVRLVKAFPRRTITLEKGDVARFERRNEVTKNAYTVVLVVHTKDGRSFTSGTLRPRELADNASRLEAWLRQQPPM